MNEIRDLMIGIDFGKKFSQICYYDRKADEARSISMKVGSSQYEAPTCVCFRMEQNDYSIGLEAEYFAREKGGIMIDHLYEISGKEAPVQVVGDEKQPWELLAVFLKEMLKFLGILDIVKNTKCMVITAPQLTACRVDNFQKACASLGFPEEKFMLLDYGESFYYYMLSQRRDTWNRNVAWYCFTPEKVFFRKMSMTSATRPVLVKLDTAVEAELGSEPEKKDSDFCRFIQDTMGSELYSSVQITGTGFDQEWAKQSVRLLCAQKRKVFYGNNLFAKGACAAAVERLEKKNLKGYLYMSDALVLTDVGMEMRVMGSPAYYPLIEAGNNWYECKAQCELILDDTEELIFTVATMEKTEKSRVAMHLPGLPKRPNKTTRLLVELNYVSPKECCITVKDLGFGDMFPASGRVWKETAQW